MISVAGSRLSRYEYPLGEHTVKTTISVSSTNREIAAARQSVFDRIKSRAPIGRSESFI